MHQSWMLFSHWLYVLTQFSGKKRISPEATQARALPAMLLPSAAGLAHRHEPLVGEHRLDDDTGAIAARHLQEMRLDLVEEALLLEIADHEFARSEAIQAAIALRGVVVDARVERQDRDHRQLVTLTHRVVIEIVCRRHLDTAGAEREIDVGVGNDRDLAPTEGQPDHLAQQVAVALIVGMDHHRRVAEHGLRACRGDDQRSTAVGQRVADVPQLSALLFLDDLEVGDRGLQDGIPVDQALAAIDQSLAVELDESLGDRARQSCVHRETLATPVG
jgi:hypothetical protein